MIFVDGDHRYEAVKSDTENVFKLLKNENSIIVWHDYTEHYELIDWEVFSGILDGTPKEKLKNIYHIKNTLCAVYINKDIPKTAKNFPEIPKNRFSVVISLKA